MSASKLEYLKRYMGSDDEPKKKKVRKVKTSRKNANIKIFDTNVDLKDVKGGSDSDDPACEDIRELAPEVAEIIDDRPLEMRSFKKTFQDTRKSSSDDEDLPRRKARCDSSSEDIVKNKRSRGRHAHSSDESPPRQPKARRDLSDETFSRNETKARAYSSDESPPRRKKGSDESPPRRSRGSKEVSSNRGSDMDSPPRRPRKSRSDAREIVPCEVVEGPETVSLRRGKNEEEIAAKKEEAEKQARRKAIYDKWTAGLIQQQQKQSQIEDIITEANKPLARSADDNDLEDRLKAMDREGDPMLAFLKKKKKVESTRPRYNGPQPPMNRYNIWPGYRWDGVDRSNGFELKMMAMKSDKMADQEQAYKWSIEDM